MTGVKNVPVIQDWNPCRMPHAKLTEHSYPSWKPLTTIKQDKVHGKQLTYSDGGFECVVRVNDLGGRTGEEQVREISHSHTIDCGRVEVSKNVDCSQEGLVSTDHTSRVAEYHLQNKVNFVRYLGLEYEGSNLHSHFLYAILHSCIHPRRHHISKKSTMVSKAGPARVEYKKQYTRLKNNKALTSARCVVNE